MPTMSPAAPTLDAIFAAWDKEDGGRDEQLTRDLSRKYVKANPERFAKLRDFGEGRQAQDRVIKALEVFKDGGLDFIVECLECQVYLWAAFEKDTVGGVAEVQMQAAGI